MGEGLPGSLSSPAPVAVVEFVVPGHDDGCHGDTVSLACGVRVG
jgi:hypothetical protein